MALRVSCKEGQKAACGAENAIFELSLSREEYEFPSMKKPNVWMFRYRLAFLRGNHGHGRIVLLYVCTSTVLACGLRTLFVFGESGDDRECLLAVLAHIFIGWHIVLPLMKR
jgi:hypothetical protein